MTAHDFLMSLLFAYIASCTLLVTFQIIVVLLTPGKNKKR